jgi:chorismate mutase / prephenate dehydratase
MQTPSADNDTQARLAPHRKRIDAIDKQIVELLNERAGCVIEIGKIKHRGSAPVYQPDRESQVLAQVRAHNKGPLPDKCVTAIWRELMSGSFALERGLRVGYLGPEGSYSHVAAKRKFGDSIEYQPVDAISQVFDMISRGQIDLGLVPIENSYVGGINETLDCLSQTRVQVYGEVLISVHHNLISKSPLDKITKVLSKGEAIAQCRNWLNVNLKGATRVDAQSTSKAVEIAANESGAAAIGSDLAAEIYGVPIVAKAIEDDPSNTTRFLIISTASAKRTGDDKTSITFTTAHQAGALANVLDVFRDHKLNLTHIDQRPSKRVNWEYNFFIDFLGHQADAQVASAIEAARKHCLHLSVLGSFPKASEVF